MNNRRKLLVALGASRKGAHCARDLRHESRDRHDPGMSRYRRSLAKGASFFFTGYAYRRRSVLTNPDVRAALRVAIADVRHALSFRITPD